MLNIILLLILGYLLGSIPFAVVISRIRGKNILEVGSKNPGAGNVFRNVGKIEGVLCWVLDAAKGAGAVALADKIFAIPMFWVVMAGVAAVIGHCWSCFLKFKGGKGASTTAGILFYIVPKIAAVAILFFFLLQIKKLRQWWMILIAIGVFWYLGWLFYGDVGRWLLWAMLILVGLGVIINIPTIREFIHENSKCKYQKSK